MDRPNLFMEDNDFNICKSWLCDSTDGQTYSLSDWFGGKLHDCPADCPKELYWDEIITGCFNTEEWEDAIGWRHDYMVDDPKVDEEAQAMADKLNAYIGKLNRQIENLKKEKGV